MSAARPRRRALRSRVSAVLLLVGALLVGSLLVASLLVATRLGGTPAAAEPVIEPVTEPVTESVTELPAGPAAGLGVSGNLLLRDGEPFLPRGFNMIGLLTPDWCPRTTGIAAREHFGPEELAAAAAWSADTLRFQVSQRGLADPDIPAEDRAAYLASVVERVGVARAAGFVVIVSMQDQYYGCGDVHPLPSAATVDAWSALAPALMADPLVAFELFNEPRNEDDAAGWAQWLSGGSTPDANLGDVAVGHQALVDHVRGLGATNLLIADAARLGERTTGMPRLVDPLGTLAYGIHPYYFIRGPSWWDEQYGDAAAEVPLLATEWNYLRGVCGQAQQQMAPDLLDYLRRHHIGVFGHAFDVPGTTIADWTWTPSECGSAVGGSGQVLRAYFESFAGLDVTPPARPLDLQATELATDRVSLGWTADADDASYVVLRDGEVIGEPTGPAWTDATVRGATSYVFTVRAVDAAGNVSGNAVALPVTTPAPPPDTTPPSPPGPVTARLDSATQVTLRWSAATDDVGVVGYRIARDDVVLRTVTGLATTDSGVAAGPHTYVVTAVDAAGNESPGSTAAVVIPATAPRGLTGTYFDTATLTTQRAVRTDQAVNFGWGTGRPVSSVAPDTFSVRWTGRILPPADGTWTFYASSDDAIRVWVDGRLVVDDWTPHALREARGSIALSANRSYEIRIEYVERTAAATARLSWSGPGTAKQSVPAGRLLSR